MMEKSKIVAFRILMIGMFLMVGYMDVSAKNVPQNTKTSSVQNPKQDNQDMEFDANDTSTNDPSKIIIGSSESIRIIPGDMVIKARIDTGATTTSLGVSDLQIINEDGIEWAVVKVEGKPMKYQIASYVLIKQHGREALKRPVVRLRLILGNVSRNTDVTLSDTRDNFKYQLLIGRNFLFDRFIVDVSLKNTSTPIEYKEK